MEPIREEILSEENQKKENPLFPFMGIGSLIYAAFYMMGRVVKVSPSTSAAFLASSPYNSKKSPT